MLGNVWEWTADEFLPYAGFSVDPYKEYSQPWFGTHKVLRGGCWATSSLLIRNSWRNFYTPDRRDVWAGFPHLRKIISYVNILLVTPRAAQDQQRQQDHRAALGNDFEKTRPSSARSARSTMASLAMLDCAPCLTQRRFDPPVSRDQPTKPMIVVLTGTDVYRDIHQSKEAHQSLELATRIVALQNMALREIPKLLRNKTK
jgi:EgtB-related family protein